ncbi:MAG: hypothetical protein K2M48_02605, partial [Clostridiales bacterium]|nr:hypothetical protein [Clostridiales bacterium]
IAIKVASAAPREPSTTANITLDFDSFSAGTIDADGKPGTAQSAYLTPISYTDANGTLHGIGVTSVNSVYDNHAEHALPFVTDNDIFAIGTTASTQSEYNEIVVLNGADVESVVDLCGTSAFFKVELVKMYASSNVFGNIAPSVLTKMGISSLTNAEQTAAGRSDIRSFYGLKITAIASTDNNYYEIDVKVKDSHDTKPAAIENVTADSVRIYVKVNNRAPSLRREVNKTAANADKTAYPFNTTEYGTYSPRAGARVASINYKMIAGRDLIITPYDLAYDFDSVSNLNKKNDGGTYTYNTNPLDADFSSTAARILKTYSVKSTATPSVAAKSTSVRLGQLSFTNEDRFKSAANEYKDYFIATMSSGFDIEDEYYAISCIKLEAVSRTTANTPLINITISDGISTVDFAISVTVENAAPKLNDPNAHYTLATGKINNKVTTTSVQLLADSKNGGIAYDVDKDSVFFDGDEVKIVAYNSTDKKYYERLTKVGDTYTPSANGPILLSDYVGASITSGTGDYIGQQVLLIEAKSSTQLFNIPIYVAVDVVDGWKAAPGEATLYVGIEVLNCKPTFDTSSLTEQDDDYFWYMPYEIVSQKTAARYIVNDKDLFESSAIPASSANKMLLFADSDKAQTALLDTGKSENVITPDLVKKANGEISDGLFTMGTAVMYTSTYTNGDNDQFLDVSVVYFTRSGSEGAYTFTAVDPSTNLDLDTYKYWAIKIVDNYNVTAKANDTQIAIRVKDDHHGKEVYTYNKDTKQLEMSPNNSSGLTVCNFYYQYLEPGIRVMHEYYRTNGNSESAVTVGGETDDKKVDFRYLDSDMFEGAMPANQDALKTATFTSEFAYRYFVNLVSGANSFEVGKRYADTADKAFYYKPVVVDADNPTTVPMSYIAMPKSFSIKDGTAGVTQTHVLPGNVNASGIYSDEAFTSTDGTPTYVAWADSKRSEYAQYRNLILDNLTLTDNDGNTWSGSANINKNPYITIEYTAEANKLSSDKYINYQRGELQYSSESSGTINKNFTTSTTFNDKSVTSPYLEDRYGFKITRKDGSSRYVGYLRLTVEVKTSSTNAAKETAFVDIEMKNSTPYDFTYTSSANYIEVSTTGLTMANADGKAPGAYVGFARGNNSATFPAGAPYTYSLKFNDKDNSDVMMFYMPSAANTVIGGENGTLTLAEQSYLIDNSVADDSLTKYLRIVNATQAADKIANNYTPNPGYEKFFSLGTVRGSTQVLQIIPVAKTALNIPANDAARASYLTENNLEEDNNGIYYPFRVLAYDSCNGSGFTEGKWVLVIVKVYISNSPIRVVTQNSNGEEVLSATGTVNTTKLTRGAASTIDVSSLIKDNDIPLVDGKYTTDMKQWPDTLPHDATSKDVLQNYGLTKDVLVMPLGEDGSTVEFSATDEDGKTIG